MPDLPGGSTSSRRRPGRGPRIDRAAPRAWRRTCLVAWLGLAIGCAGGTAAGPPPAEPIQAPTALAEEDHHQPSYGKPELSRALIAERAAEASAERLVAELEDRPASPAADDQLRVALADLAVRRRFLRTLEVCESAGAWCPPRLDDPAWAFDPDPDGDRRVEPPVTSTLRFDLDSWRTLAAELHGRACACRTLACVDSLGVAIDQLELRPMPQVRGDDAATASVTRARACLFRLRGKTAMRAPQPLPVDD